MKTGNKKVKVQMVIFYKPFKAIPIIMTAVDAYTRVLRKIMCSYLNVTKYTANLNLFPKSNECKMDFDYET